MNEITYPTLEEARKKCNDSYSTVRYGRIYRLRGTMLIQHEGQTCLYQVRTRLDGDAQWVGVHAPVETIEPFDYWKTHDMLVECKTPFLGVGDIREEYREERRPAARKRVTKLLQRLIDGERLPDYWDSWGE